MTDAELAAFLGLVPGFESEMQVASLTAGTRATYERMAQVERELNAWSNGTGPKPRGVMVDGPRKRGGRLA